MRDPDSQAHHTPREGLDSPLELGLLIAPQLEFTPLNERVGSLCLRVGDRSSLLFVGRMESLEVSGRGAGRSSDRD